MPTSHGSLALHRAGARSPPTRSTWPGCGPRARCRSARPPPPSSARSTSPRPRPAASPATRGTPSARRVGRAAAAPPRWPPGWCPSATASDGGGSTRIPASFCRAGRVQAEPRPHPPPGSHRLRDGGVRRCSPRPWPTAPATSTWWPGPTTATGSRCPPTGVSLRGGDRDSLPVEGLRARWSVDLGLRPLRPRGAGADRGGGPRAGRGRRAGARRRAGRAHRPGPHLAGQRARSTCGSTSSRGMWPGVADDLTRYCRSVAASRPRTTRSPSSPSRSGGASSWSPTPPACSPRSTWCSRPRPRCPPSPPRARRPT